MVVVVEGPWVSCDDMGCLEVCHMVQNGVHIGLSSVIRMVLWLAWDCRLWDLWLTLVCASHLWYVASW